MPAVAATHRQEVVGLLKPHSVSLQFRHEPGRDSALGGTRTPHSPDAMYACPQQRGASVSGQRTHLDSNRRHAVQPQQAGLEPGAHRGEGLGHGAAPADLGDGLGRGSVGCASKGQRGELQHPARYFRTWLQACVIHGSSDTQPGTQAGGWLDTARVHASMPWPAGRRRFFSRL